MATAQFEPRPAAAESHCSDARINEVFSGGGCQNPADTRRMSGDVPEKPWRGVVLSGARSAPRD